MTTIPISSIVVGTRMREDLGDITNLAESIRTYGLIQPIVLNSSNELIAGGRRLTAAKSLGWTEIPYVTRDTPLGEAQLREMELEENVRRKSMTWQENAKAIAKIHALRSMSSALVGQDWGLKQTGELLGCTGANVSYALTLARALNGSDKSLEECGSAKEALQLLMERREQEVVARLAKNSLPTPVANPTVVSLFATDEELPEEPVETFSIPISTIAHHGDCIAWMDSFAEGLIDHIVSDPPYGIDMKNLSQENQGMDISRIEAEHDVESNLTLFEQFFPRAFKMLKPSGFCVLWCDAWNFRHMADLAVKAGFRVQRWPLVWNKTHSCINQAAQYNYTKATEFALVCRKPNSVLAMHQPVNYFLASNDDTKTGGSPFAKPEAAWGFIYSAIATPGQTVLDPFAGAGSSLVSAVKHGLRPLLVESNPEQYNNLLIELRRVYSIYFPNINLV